MFKFLEKLCSVNAPSGYEDELISTISDRLDELGVTYNVYPSGNVVASLPSKNPSAPSIMVQCHMDEVGFMVKGHRDGGFLSISPLGITDVTELVGKRVTLLADTPFRGSIGAVPVHLSKGKDKPSLDDLYADVGIMKKEDAAKSIPLGTFGCFDASTAYFGKDDAYISGKALSSRVPCTILLEAIKSLKDSHPSAHVYFAFTVRGKLSLCGATEAYNKICPDTVISVTGIPADDTPDNTSPICRLGHGLTIPKGEARYHFDQSITTKLHSAANDSGIHIQNSRPLTEDEDADFDILRIKNAGARISAVKLPVRNIRTSCEVVSKDDVHAALALLSSALKSLEV